MAHDHDIDAVPDLLFSECQHSLLFAKVLLCGVCPTGSGGPPCQANAQVGVKQSVQPDRQTVAQHRLDHAVSEIVVCKAVTVMYKYTFVCNLCFERFGVQLDTDFLVQVPSHPEIVVPGEIVDGYPAIGEVLQSGQRAVKSFRDDGCIFKPEVKEIADNKQLFSVRKDTAEECQQAVLLLTFFLTGAEAEVDIGDEIDRHLTIYEKRGGK